MCLLKVGVILSKIIDIFQEYEGDIDIDELGNCNMVFNEEFWRE